MSVRLLGGGGLRGLNENDPAFNSGTVDPVDETVVEDDPLVETTETTATE